MTRGLAVEVFIVPLIAQSLAIIEIGPILLGLIGGLALFLYGLDLVSDALTWLAGDGLKKLLARLTTNRFTGAVAGALVTAIIQSSSVTTVLVVGFISAGLLTLAQSIGVIMGANIGTTITTQLIAFQVTRYALLLVSLGFFTLFFTRHEQVRHYGRLLMGLGLIFFGMQLMSDGAQPLRTYQPFMDLMGQMNSPLAAIFISAAFTAAVQSSSATTGLVITLASQGFISLEAGIALVFGANVGTCITAVLASLGKPREAVRAAIIHVLFNAAGVLMWCAFIPQLAVFIGWISPSQPHLSGVARLAAETPRQIANAHTVFNLANTLIFIWFTKPFEWIVYRIVPDRRLVDIEFGQPKYLDPALIQTPALAMDVVRLELGRLGAAATHMMSGALETIVQGSRDEIDALESLDKHVDSLHAAIVAYLARLSRQNLTAHQAQELRTYLSAANHIESIGDTIETNLVDAGRARLKANLRISPMTVDILNALNQQVVWAGKRAIEALVDNDRRSALEVVQAKHEISRLAAAAEQHLSERLAADEPNRLAAFRLESEIMEYLKRMYYLAKRIAKLVGEEEDAATGLASQSTK